MCNVTPLHCSLYCVLSAVLHLLFKPNIEAALVVDLWHAYTGQPCYVDTHAQSHCDEILQIQ